MKRVLIIGLDCAEPDLVFNRFKNSLPNLSRLMEQGDYGKLNSTIPAITIPAWSSMFSGKDPGELGFYGFRNRKAYDYSELVIVNSRNVRVPRLWDLLGYIGKKSIIVGIPQTFPPKEINGLMVTCFLTPSKDKPYTYPANLKYEVEQVAPEYEFDVKGFRTENKDWLLSAIYNMTEQRFKLVKHLLSKKYWDLFAFVEMGTDRLHHGFWKFMDKDHPLYPGDNNPYRDTIEEYYNFIDRQIGEILNLLPSDTEIFVVSDHGAKGMMGGFAFNDWLIQKGYLVLKERPASPQRLTNDMINWEKTKVWGSGGYYARVFLNVRGREPHGTIPADKKEDFLKELKKELEDIKGPDNSSLQNRVFDPREIYRETRGIPPDLIVYLGDLSWRSIGTVGNERLFHYENDTGPDDANHAQEGIYITGNKGILGKDGQADIKDIFYTIMKIFKS